MIIMKLIIQIGILKLKEECLKYLEKDVLGLLEVLNKMSS